MDYSEFLYTKIPEAQRNGFAVDESEINPMAFPHQRDTIRWAILGGRRAVFASFGLEPFERDSGLEVAHLGR